MKREVVNFHDIDLSAKPAMITGATMGRTPRIPWTDYPPRQGWLLHIYSYSGKLAYAGHTYEFHDGWASLIPAAKGWREGWPVTPSHHVYSRFRLAGAEEAGEQRCRLPVVWDLAERADRFKRRFRTAVSRFPENPLRAEVALWELLFDLTDSCEHPLPAANNRLPLIVREAFRFIETALCDPITAEDVAAAVGLSYSHLASLFRKHVGTGIAAYVRTRKMRVAEELLCNSRMPIKTIAAQIGMTDLQHFNKLIHTAFGTSPRTLRKRAMEG